MKLGKLPVSTECPSPLPIGSAPTGLGVKMALVCPVGSLLSQETTNLWGRHSQDNKEIPGKQQATVRCFSNRPLRAAAPWEPLSV